MLEHPSNFYLKILLTEEMTEVQFPAQILHDKDQTHIRDVDGHSSISSYETQYGVKNIEAISQTRTRWSLISAYEYVG